MKTPRFQKRFYRDWVNAKDLYLLHFMAKETDLYILTDKRLDKDFIDERVRALRWDIENYINRDRRFLTALKPIEVELGAPFIVKEMAESAKAANVGPMACVAGAIAGFLGKDLLKKGYREVIVENGGDIFLKSCKKRTVGIYSGKSSLWNKLRIKIKPENTPLGICTSSGTIGHSLSFGCADSVVVLSKRASLADAVATASANRVKTKEDLQGAINFARAIKGICGIAIVLKNRLVSWGEIEFVK